MTIFLTLPIAEAYESDISRLKYEIAAKEERHTDEVTRTHDEYKVQLTQLEEALKNQHLGQVETCKYTTRFLQLAVWDSVMEVLCGYFKLVKL